MNFLGLTGKAIAATVSRLGNVNHMAKKEILDKLSIYIPQKKMEEKPVERLIKFSSKKDRSINYLVVEAIIEYVLLNPRLGSIALCHPFFSASCLASSFGIFLGLNPLRLREVNPRLVTMLG